MQLFSLMKKIWIFVDPREHYFYSMSFDFIDKFIINLKKRMESRAQISELGGIIHFIGVPDPHPNTI